MGPCPRQASLNGNSLLAKVKGSYGSATLAANHFCVYQDQKILPPCKIAHLQTAERCRIIDSGKKIEVVAQKEGLEVWIKISLEIYIKLETVHSHLVCHAHGYKLK